MRVFIVRHGETEDAVAKIHQRRNCALSVRGIRQAQQLAERLKYEQFEHMYVSPFPRTRQTAEPLVKQFADIPFTIEENIREINTGVLEGSPKGSFTKAAAAAGVDDLSFVPEGGESAHAVRERFLTFFTQLPTLHAGDVLLVTHGFPIMAALTHVHGLPFERAFDFHPSNTSLSILEYLPDGTWHVHAVNDSSHLDAEDVTL